MIYKKFDVFLEQVNENWTKWFIDKMIENIKSKLKCDVTEQEVVHNFFPDKGVRKFTIKTSNKKLLKKILEDYSNKVKDNYYLSYEIIDRGEVFQSSKGELALKVKLKKPPTRVKPPKFIYHQTDPGKVKEIMEMGLIPKSSKNSQWNTAELGYPDVLFFSSDLDKLFYANNVITLKIDTEKIPKEIKFWADYNMYKDTETKGIKYIMTYDKIPSEAIVDLLDPKGDKLKDVGDDFFYYKGHKFPK